MDYNRSDDGVLLSTDDFRKNLKTYIDDKGLLCEIKAKIRNDLVGKITGKSTLKSLKPIQIDGLRDRVSISIVYDYLLKNKLKRSISVLIAESGLDYTSTFLNASEITEFLSLPNVDGTCIVLDRIISHMQDNLKSKSPLINRNNNNYSSTRESFDRFMDQSLDTSKWDEPAYQLKLRQLKDMLKNREIEILHKEEDLEHQERHLKERERLLILQESEIIDEKDIYQKELNEQKQNIQNLNQIIQRQDDQIKSLLRDIDTYKHCEITHKDTIDRLNQEKAVLQEENNALKNQPSPSLSQEILMKRYQASKQRYVALSHKYDELKSIVKDQGKTIQLLQQRGGGGGDSSIHTTTTNTTSNTRTRTGPSSATTNTATTSSTHPKSFSARIIENNKFNKLNTDVEVMESSDRILKKLNLVHLDTTNPTLSTSRDLYQPKLFHSNISTSASLLNPLMSSTEMLSFNRRSFEVDLPPSLTSSFMPSLSTYTNPYNTNYFHDYYKPITTSSSTIMDPSSHIMSTLTTAAPPLPLPLPLPISSSYSYESMYPPSSMGTDKYLPTNHSQTNHPTQGMSSMYTNMDQAPYRYSNNNITSTDMTTTTTTTTTTTAMSNQMNQPSPSTAPTTNMMDSHTREYTPASSSYYASNSSSNTAKDISQHKQPIRETVNTNDYFPMSYTTNVMPPLVQSSSYAIVKDDKPIIEPSSSYTRLNTDTLTGNTYDKPSFSSSTIKHSLDDNITSMNMSSNKLVESANNLDSRNMNTQLEVKPNHITSTPMTTIGSGDTAYMSTIVEPTTVYGNQFNEIPRYDIAYQVSSTSIKQPITFSSNETASSTSDNIGPTSVMDTIAPSQPTRELYTTSEDIGNKNINTLSQKKEDTSSIHSALMSNQVSESAASKPITKTENISMINHVTTTTPLVVPQVSTPQLSTISSAPSPLESPNDVKVEESKYDDIIKPVEALQPILKEQQIEENIDDVRAKILARRRGVTTSSISADTKQKNIDQTSSRVMSPVDSTLTKDNQIGRGDNAKEDINTNTTTTTNTTREVEQDLVLLQARERVLARRRQNNANTNSSTATTTSKPSSYYSSLINEDEEDDRVLIRSSYAPPDFEKEEEEDDSHMDQEDRLLSSRYTYNMDDIKNASPPSVSMASIESLEHEDGQGDDGDDGSVNFDDDDDIVW